MYSYPQLPEMLVKQTQQNQANPSQVERATVQTIPAQKRRYVLRPGFVAALLCVAQLAVSLGGDHAPSVAHAEEAHCLALNIYHEARSEPTAGKLAVAAVTANRVASRHYPDSICEVVWQPRQFSWTNLKKKYHTPSEAKAWDEAQELADLFMHGARWTGVGDAKHYHTKQVSPSWSENQQVVAKLGNHLFYRL